MFVFRKPTETGRPALLPNYQASLPKNRVRATPFDTHVNCNHAFPLPRVKLIGKLPVGGPASALQASMAWSNPAIRSLPVAGGDFFSGEGGRNTTTELVIDFQGSKLIRHSRRRDSPRRGAGEARRAEVARLLWYPDDEGRGFS